MYQIQCLNKISEVGTSCFNANYVCGTDVQNPDAILVRSASMHEMEFNPELLAIARAGAGVNNIPLDKCSEQGIAVFNTPGANANAVKELVLAALLLSSRRIVDGIEWLRTLKGQGAEISNYFEEIAMDMEAACYGSYFLELADYYGRENLDGTEMLKLIYQSLRALLKPAIPNVLVRRIYELKSMVINGEYTEWPPRKVSDSAVYAWTYVTVTPVESLYRFTLTEDVLKEFSGCVEENMRRYIDRHFHSLDILNTLSDAGGKMPQKG